MKKQKQAVKKDSNIYRDERKDKQHAMNIYDLLVSNSLSPICIMQIKFLHRFIHPQLQCETKIETIVYLFENSPIFSSENGGDVALHVYVKGKLG